MSEAGVVSLLRRRTTWEIVAVLAAVVATGAAVRDADAELWEWIAYAAAPVVVLATVLADEVGHRRWLAVGGLLLAVPPVAVADLAAGRRAGAVAALVGAGVVVAVRRPPRDQGLRIALMAAVGIALVALWTAAGETRSGPTPPWDEIVATTGASTRAAIVPGGAPFGSGPMLLWAAGGGVVVAAALLAGRRRLAVLPPAALAVFVAAAWLIEWASGPVAASDGTWIVGAAVAATGASVGLSRIEDRRLGRAVLSLALASWAWAAADEAGRLDSSAVTLALATVAPVLAGVWMWSASRAPARRPAGVNVVGYFDVTSGLGERARALAATLRAGGVAVGEWNVAGAASPTRNDRNDRDDRVERDAADTAVVYDTTVAVVTALEFGALADSHRELLDDSRVIGYWFWELATVPESHAHALGMVDEVWAPTRFVASAYEQATDKPVRHVPLPIPEPAVGPQGEPELRGDTLFLVSFDHLSVMERKNPLGAIEAFGRAFPDGDEPVRLVVKTINANRKPDAARRLAAAARHDDRIEIRDAHLGDREHAELVRDADAFVSLHRSEGLGLHLGDAMWLGTPVIASAYGGSTDLLDERCALLVPVDLTAVVDGDGAYPPGALWAEPDLDAAAAAMRTVVRDPEAVADLARAALAVMRSQPSARTAGRSLVRVLRGWSADGRAPWSSAGSGRVDSVASMSRTSEPSDPVRGGPVRGGPVGGGAV